MAGTIEDYKCILITGATAGIGRMMARRLTQLPSRPTIIAVGRRKERLDELQNEGMEAIQYDTNCDEKGLGEFTQRVLQKYPNLDGIMLFAGMQKDLDLKKPNGIEITVTTIMKFMPHFLERSEKGSPSMIATVTSGLAIVPAAWAPNYSASKAALHSFTESLRLQMKGTKIRVTEILPPLVESELHDKSGTTAKLAEYWVPLDKFTDTVIAGLKKGVSD